MAKYYLGWKSSVNKNGEPFTDQPPETEYSYVYFPRNLNYADPLVSVNCKAIVQADNGVEAWDAIKRDFPSFFCPSFIQVADDEWLREFDSFQVAHWLKPVFVHGARETAGSALA
jgi:hypothetical protein